MRGSQISKTWLVMKQWLALVMFFTSQCTGEEGARAGGPWGGFFPTPWGGIEESISDFSELWQDWCSVVCKKVGMECAAYEGKDGTVARKEFLKPKESQRLAARETMGNCLALGYLEPD